MHGQKNIKYKIEIHGQQNIKLRAKRNWNSFKFSADARMTLALSETLPLYQHI
jgi:hypothetical protein